MLRMLALAGTLAFGTAMALPAQSSGRLVRVYGDLTTADRVAIVVPGADTTVANFDHGVKRPGGAAKALLAETAKVGHGERLAVVAWLGYDAPPTWGLGAVTETAAVEGAKALRRTITELRERTAAPIALLCHSYGSVVCAKAAPGLPIADMALVGSPGIDATSTHAPTGTRVWAGLGARDWIRYVPKTKLGPLGFGADALTPGYGARAFEVGPGGHSDYFAPGTASLRNLTLIALGRPNDVSPALQA
ncbi:alpha/beta hydrolase [Nonomuraea rhizosphaerae]|uniref:alpha/beta hydrolase n=1 Tax=Nonomuraea rhizosphaerae TaxID=2665663 RepID=UPI001C5CEF94|nr:alpha/beta hydrolase [Nonomuraea rhizosphaerae]